MKSKSALSLQASSLKRRSLGARLDDRLGGLAAEEALRGALPQLSCSPATARPAPAISFAGSAIMRASSRGRRRRYSADRPCRQCLSLRLAGQEIGTRRWLRSAISAMCATICDGVGQLDLRVRGLARPEAPTRPWPPAARVPLPCLIVWRVVSGRSNTQRAGNCSAAISRHGLPLPCDRQRRGGWRDGMRCAHGSVCWPARRCSIARKPGGSPALRVRTVLVASHSRICATPSSLSRSLAGVNKMTTPIRRPRNSAESRPRPKATLSKPRQRPAAAGSARPARPNGRSWRKAWSPTAPRPLQRAELARGTPAAAAGRATAGAPAATAAPGAVAAPVQANASGPAATPGQAASGAGRSVEPGCGAGQGSTPGQGARLQPAGARPGPVAKARRRRRRDHRWPAPACAACPGETPALPPPAPDGLAAAASGRLPRPAPVAPLPSALPIAPAARATSRR